MKQEAYGIYYVVTQWNYYLHRSDIVVYNDHKPLQKFLTGKNANNKVNRWSWKVVTYNIIFEWISGSCNKAADCISQLVDVTDTPVAPTTSIYMLVTSNPDGPAIHTNSKRRNTPDTIPVDPMTTSTNDKVNTPPPLTEDWKDTLDSCRG